MAKQKTEGTDVETTTEAVNDKPKRKQLTAAERVAKLEAELAAARERAEKKANKQRDELVAKRNSLGEKRDKLDQQIQEIERQLESL